MKLEGRAGIPGAPFNVSGKRPPCVQKNTLAFFPKNGLLEITPTSENVDRDWESIAAARATLSHNVDNVSHSLPLPSQGNALMARNSPLLAGTRIAAFEYRPTLEEPEMMPQILLEAEELAKAVKNGNVTVIDTRDPEAYARGHIPGAVNMRQIFTYLATTDTDGLAALKDTFATLFAKAGVCAGSTVVFYEESMSTGFGQSCRGYFLLTSLGHQGGAILHGGLKAWMAAGLPLSYEPPFPMEGNFIASAEPTSLVATRTDVFKGITDPSVVILDVRDRDEWEGHSSSPYGVDFCPRKGRIPNAVWIEWYRFMNEDEQGTFRSNTEILQACKEVGIAPGTKVYVYCFKGARASNTFVALRKAGVTDVKIYLGSWNEWSRDLNLPIDEGLVAAA